MGKNKLLTIALPITLALAMAGCTNKHPYQVRQDCYAAIETYVASHKEYTTASYCCLPESFSTRMELILGSLSDHYIKDLIKS